VAGAGNDGDTTNAVMAPASCAGVLAVGAIDNQKRAWRKTQRQPYVTVAAPGYWVGAIGENGRFIPNLSGTSQASGLTSGAVALLRSRFPQMPAREVVQRITNTTVDAGPKGKDDMTGYGTVVPILALTRNVPKNAPNPVFEKFDQWQAAQPKPTQNPTTNPQNPKTEEDSGTKNTPYIAILGGLGVLIALAVIILVKTLRRRERATAPHQYGPPGSYPGTPPFGGPPGPSGPPHPGTPHDPRPYFAPPTGHGRQDPYHQGPPPPPQH
jgi:subtilisin family serine protease